MYLLTIVVYIALWLILERPGAVAGAVTEAFGDVF